MTEILLFSKNKDSIDILTELLSPADYDLAVNPFSSSKNPVADNTKIIIMDICNTEINNDPVYKDLLKKISISKKPLLIILQLKQTEMISSLIELCEGIEDIIFQERLVEEIIPRIDLISSKILNPDDDNNIISVGGIMLDPEKFELTVDGHQVELTFKEYELLKFLIENKNRVFSRSKLLSVIWGYDFYGGSRTVDVHMRRLRTKLEPYDGMLKTVRNVGYMFAPAH